MAAIASMCVQPEVSHWPSMGEVVQALLPLFKDSTAASDSSPQEEFSAPGRTRISVTTSSQPNSQNLSSTSINSSDYDSEPLSSSKWTVSLIKNINGLWPTHQAAHRFFPSS